MKSVTPSFVNNRGRCTRYALACGYADLWLADKSKRTGDRVRMWLADGTLIVAVVREDGGGDRWVFPFIKLAQARRQFNDCVRELKAEKKASNA